MTKTNDPPLVASVALIPDSDEKADLDAPSDESGKLVVGQVPNISISETIVVADQAERLTLEVQEGDVAIQQDTTESYIFTGGPNIEINWQLVQFDAVGGIAGEDIAPRDIDGRNLTVNDVSTGTLNSSMTLTANNVTINGLLNGADTSGASAGEALTSDGQGGFGFSAVGIVEVATFDDLPTVDPPQIGYVVDQEEYYSTTPISGTPFDLTSSTFSKSINSQTTRPTGIAWNNDGTQLYETRDFPGEIFQSTLSTPFDISTASLQTSINAQDDGGGIAWNNDGSQLYQVGDGVIFQFDVSTPFDISTASLTTSINSEATFPSAIAWNNDGSQLYEVGENAGVINQLSLSTPFDISTASFSSSISSQAEFPGDIAWNTDGSQLYEMGEGDIFQLSLSTPFDITSASLSTTIPSQGSNSTGIAWNNDGTRLFEIGFPNDQTIYQSDLLSGGWEEI